MIFQLLGCILPCSKEPSQVAIIYSHYLKHSLFEAPTKKWTQILQKNGRASNKYIKKIQNSEIRRLLGNLKVFSAILGAI